MVIPARWSQLWWRFRHLPWARIAIGSVAVMGIVAIVPPFRKAAFFAAERMIFFAAAPISPDISGFDRLPATSRIVASDGSVLAELAGERREPVRLDELPPHIPKAVLAAEDENFYSHDGVDLGAIVRAVVRSSQGNTQGGSTITQQLAKINYTNSERTMLRKLREVLYASRLERNYSKDELLERYLNQAYFGDGAHGIGAAAREYFGIEPEKLSVPQAALLAGKIHSPEELDPRTRPDRVKARRDIVLDNMEDNGWLSEQDFANARATRVEVIPPPPGPANKAPHFVDFVIEEAKQLDALGGTPESRANQVFAGGYTFETTLDPKAFDAAVQAIQARLAAPEDPATAVVSVQPGDGAIRAMVSGLDPSRKFNLAEHPKDGRQPGSAFKPFVYLAALRSGIDPRSMIDARSPKELEYRGSKYTVDNYEGQGEGFSTIDDALVHSINTVFAELILEVDPGNVVKTAKAAGLQHPDRPLEDDRFRPAVALGGLRHGVTPLEMAAAYATFAAKGTYAKPYAIARVRDREGTVVHQHAVQTHRAFDQREAGVLNAAMLGVVERGTGTAASIGRPVAGKTGTTQRYGDAWFVGFVPQLSTAVWVGYPDEIRPMESVHGRRVSGGSFPAEIWGQMMRTTMAGVPVQPIFTASPDALGLRLITTTTSSTTTTSTSSTTTTLPLPPPPPPAPTYAPTTRPGNGNTNRTTTTARPTTTSTTSTTVKKSNSEQQSPPTSNP